jgi:hypothetical protein
MTCIAVQCPHCQSEQIVRRGKMARGTQRYLVIGLFVNRYAFGRAV